MELGCVNLLEIRPLALFGAAPSQAATCALAGAAPNRWAHNVPPANEPAARETAKAVTIMMRVIGTASASSCDR